MTHLATLYLGAVITVFMIALAHHRSFRRSQTTQHGSPWTLF